VTDDDELDELELALRIDDDELVPPADLRDYLAGVLTGALARDPELAVEHHRAGARRLAGLEIRDRFTGERVVVHFDRGL
jgi:hypothetical protein